MPLLAADTIVTVPMAVQRNLPFVQVMVNGKGPFTFGIDTGTGGQALVSPALVEQLGLPVTGETEVGDPSRTNGRKVKMIHIDSLKLEGVEFTNVEATQYPGQLRESTDGILGFVLFRDFLLTLDYPQQQVRLARGSLAPADGIDVLAFRMPDNVPVVELIVGSQKIDAHVDSRGMGLSLPAKFAQGLRFASEPVVLGRGRTVSNEFEIKGAQLTGDIELGGYTFSKPFVEVNPLFPIANFGSAALQDFAVTFDQKNKLVRFLASDKVLTLAPPHRMAALQPALPPHAQGSPHAASR
jgi:hypothetical protein